MGGGRGDLLYRINAPRDDVVPSTHSEGTRFIRLGSIFSPILEQSRLAGHHPLLRVDVASLPGQHGDQARDTEAAVGRGVSTLRLGHGDEAVTKPLDTGAASSDEANTGDRANPGGAETPLEVLERVGGGVEAHLLQPHGLSASIPIRGFGSPPQALKS